MVKLTMSGNIRPQCPKCAGENFATATEPKPGNPIRALSPITCDDCGYVCNVEDAVRAAEEAAAVVKLSPH